MGGGGDRLKAHLWVGEVVAGFGEASGSCDVRLL